MKDLGPKSAFVLLALTSVVSLSFGQAAMGNSGARNKRKNAPKAKLVPIHILVDTAGFPVIELPKDKYVLMASEMAEFPKGFAGKVTAPHKVIMITYGAKAGGVVRYYQTKAVAGITPEDFVRKVGELGSFHDINRRPNWTLKGFVKGGVYYVVTSGDKKTVNDAVAISK